MKKLFIILVVFLLLLPGCSKKEDDSAAKKSEPPKQTQPPEPVQEEEEPPVVSDGVLGDDDDFAAILPPPEYEEPITTLTPQPADQPSVKPEPKPTPPPPTQPSSATPPVADAGKLKIDTVDTTRYLDDGGKFWDAIYIGARQVGFQSTEFSRQTIQDHPVLCVIARNVINVLHLGSPTEISAAHRSFETPQGEMIGNTSKIKRDSLVIDQIAKVVEESLEITTKMEGKTTTEVLPWKTGQGTGGFCAIQISLFKNPIQENEERRVAFYDPTRQEVVDAILAARDIEMIDILGKNLNLRKIDAIFKTPQTQIPVTFWTDGVGNIIRMSTPFVGTETLTSIRTTQEAIKAFSTSSPTVDVGAMPILPLAQPVPNPNAMPNIEFTVRWKGEVPTDFNVASLFPNTAFQTVRPDSNLVAKIAVRSAVNVDPSGLPPDGSKSTDSDLGSNQWIAADDPVIQQTAEEAVGAADTPWKKAVALERWVCDNIHVSAKDFGTAVEVAKNRKGDASGVAFLLASLARAQKIPTRVVAGLVYTKLNTPESEKSGALTFHLWNEMLIDNHWIPMDGTLGLGGASAVRIQIADSDLETSSFVTLASKILQIAGNLEVNAGT